MIDIFSKLMQPFTDHRAKKTSWGRVLGTLILVVVFFTWSYLCIHKKEWIEIDQVMAVIVVGIYILNSIKSVVETTSVANPTKPEEEEDTNG